MNLFSPQKVKHYKHFHCYQSETSTKSSRIITTLLKAAPPFQLIRHEITLKGLIISQSDKKPAGTRQSVNSNHREQTQNKPCGSAGGNEKPSSPKKPHAVHASLTIEESDKKTLMHLLFPCLSSY